MGNALGAVIAITLGTVIGYWTLNGKMVNIANAIRGVNNTQSNPATPTQPNTAQPPNTNNSFLQNLPQGVNPTYQVPYMLSHYIP